MKVEITSVNCCIPLTETQWRILNRKERAYTRRRFNKPFIHFPETWEFPNYDKVDEWDWNGHFGRNIFFRAQDGAEQDVLTFLKKYLR